MATQAISATAAGTYDDSWHRAQSLTSATAARNATTSNFDTQHTGPILYSIAGYSTLSMIGATTHMVYRTFLNFTIGPSDAAAGETITSAVLRLHQLTDLSGFVGYSAGGNLHICEATGAAAYSANTAWNDLDGWQSSGSYSGNVTEYASAVTCQSNTTYNINLNSTAISDLNSAASTAGGGGVGVFYVGLIHSYDFLDTGYTAGSGVLINFKGAYLAAMEHGTVDYRPQLTVTYGELANNSVFFGTNF